MARISSLKVGASACPHKQTWLESQNQEIQLFFHLRKGLFSPLRGRIAFCLQSAAPLKREPFGYGVLERLGQSPQRSPLLRRKHDDVADGALLAAGGHVDDLTPEIERRRAAAVQIERKFRALVEEELL